MLAAGVNGHLAAVDFSAESRVACLTDPADNSQLAAVSPGQIVSIFGTDLTPAVSFDEVAAAIIYASPQQINVQVPAETASHATSQLQVVSETQPVAVVAQQPTYLLTAGAFLSPFAGMSVCGDNVAFGEAAHAINPDGTLNDCTNPAPAGSLVTVFLNGLGTGIVSQQFPAGVFTFGDRRIFVWTR